MIVSIHQPAYLPWLGYFARIARSDRFVFLDNVQFQRRSFQNRNRIRTSNGATWLTVPVETKGRIYTTTLAELPICNDADWRGKHLRAITHNYSKAPFRDREMPYLESVYARPWDRLAELCWSMLGHYVKRLGLTCELIRASDLDPFEHSKSALMLEICERLNASMYISGPLGRNYLDQSAFAAAGISVDYDEFEHPHYPQVYDGFEANMAAIDFMMNVADPAEMLAAKTLQT